MKKILLLISLSATLLVEAQQDGLKNIIERISQDANGKVGAAFLDVTSGRRVSVNGSARLPMQSVMKLPIAMAVLYEVDKHRLALDNKVFIGPKDLRPTYSPIYDKYPDGNIRLSIAELLKYMVSFSDNNACDILLKQIRGTATVERYLHGIHIQGISVKASEYSMTRDWSVQYTNWCQPDAMANLLHRLYEHKCLSAKSTSFLINLLTQTSTGPNRIKGLLPKGVEVAHKTGTSGTNKEGITAATNDAGVITLPNGNRFILVVFVSDAAADEKTRESVIARIARACWDAETTK